MTTASFEFRGEGSDRLLRSRQGLVLRGAVELRFVHFCSTRFHALLIWEVFDARDEWSCFVLDLELFSGVHSDIEKGAPPPIKEDL